jgi:long-chain fatty acid transport protein
LREQSAYWQGSAFAGAAAGGDLSSLFWNPATMTQVQGIQTEIVASGILPYAKNNPSAGSTLFALGGTGDTADDALVPSGYMSWQINPNLWAGLSLNSPFGLSVSFPDLWAGRDYAANRTSLKSYNFTPSLAYKINNWISVGVGVQVQYATATLNRGITLAGPTFVDSTLSGNGWAYGFTAGATFTPTPTTTIGLGYRSALNQKIDGSLTLTGPLAPFSNPNVSTTLDLPDVVSLGIKQQVGPQWTLLGTIEWTNWSRIGTANVNATVGATPVTIPFQYDDGWFFSLGAQYQWTPQLALRGGVGYEKSPVTDAVRIPLLPDNDRFWTSIGATYDVTPQLSLDFAYSHLFVKNTSINVVPGNPSFDGVAYIGTVNAHVDIISAALKYRWDAPMTKTALIVK